VNDEGDDLGGRISLPGGDIEAHEAGCAAHYGDGPNGWNGYKMRQGLKVFDPGFIEVHREAAPVVGFRRARPGARTFDGEPALRNDFRIRRYPIGHKSLCENPPHPPLVSRL